MMIHAYSEDYLVSAQRILGDMLDYAVNTYAFDPDSFYQMFLVSDVSSQFQNGNPTYVAGKTGCEIVKEIIHSAGIEMQELEDEMYLDKSPEYWAGWALAYYQWYTGRTFIKIYKVVSVQELLDMYDVYHEMDIQKFVDEINERWEAFYTDTNLKINFRVISERTGRIIECTTQTDSAFRTETTEYQPYQSYRCTETCENSGMQK